MLTEMQLLWNILKFGRLYNVITANANLEKVQIGAKYQNDIIFERTFEKPE